MARWAKIPKKNRHLRDEKSWKNRTAVQINFDCGVTIGALRCKFSWTAVRFLTNFCISQELVLQSESQSFTRMFVFGSLLRREILQISSNHTDWMGWKRQQGQLRTTWLLNWKFFDFHFVFLSLIRTFDSSRRYLRSEIKMKIPLSFCISLAYSYLCHKD